MTVVDTVVRLTHHIARRAAHAIVHPVETAGAVADVAETTASAVMAVVRDAEREAAEQPTPTESTEEPTPTATSDSPGDLFPPVAPLLTEPIDQLAVTEPKPAGVDDWRDELAEPEEDDVAAPPPVDDDEPLLDPSVAKAVRHESARMRRAAERDPGDAATDAP